LVHSNKERLDLVLPAVKKKGKEIFPREAHEDISKEENLKLQKDRNHKITFEGNIEEIIMEETEVTYWSPDVPTSKYIDIPGLVPTTMNGKINGLPKKILDKYSDQKRYGSIDLLLCQSAKCDSSPGMGQFIPNLSNILVIFTKIDKVSVQAKKSFPYKQTLNMLFCFVSKFNQSNDEDWEDYFDEENPGVVKSSRFYRLADMIDGTEHECVGLYNKNTASKARGYISIRDQNKIEQEWIQNVLGRREISSRVAEQLGIKAYAKQLDLYRLFHLKDYIETSHDKAVELMMEKKKELTELGTDPSQIKLGDLQEAAYDKIKIKTQDAVHDMERKIYSI
jgi:hypothetical protein